MKAASNLGRHVGGNEGINPVMRVFIAGIDGYLGWTLTQHLVSRGHEVAGADAFMRRAWVAEMGSDSIVPIASMEDRLAGLQQHMGMKVPFWEGDLREFDLIERIFTDFRPEAVVHLGECPSAPYSMIDRAHTMFVQLNNITTTFNLMFAIREHCPDAHLLKLGTMGEYGTPNVDIPEGFFDVEFRGRSDRLPFPRQAGSWYHWSKVHGSNNIMFACKIWGLRATDVMQGVVFGTRTDTMLDDPRLRTRLDCDQAFGTAINRFVCQALIGHPLTPYGAGRQVRGFLPLGDSMQCLTLALEHPPSPGEYRVFNQFEETYSIYELAEIVQRAGRAVGLDPQISSVANPRAAVELAEHHYQPDRQHLVDLGYRPQHDVESAVRDMLMDLAPYKDRVQQIEDSLLPDVHWSGQREKVGFLTDEKAGR